VSDESGTPENLWQSKSISLILVCVALAITVLVPGVGVIGAFLVALVAAVVGRKVGSFRDMGLRSPDSWPKLLGTTFLYGVVIQFASTVLIEPLLERITGSAVDISALDGIRGNLAMCLVWIAIGWVMGGFLEEFAFRGFVVTRVHKLLGSRPAAIWVAILVAAVPFGIAHMYQGPAGMIGTGLVGFVLGVIFLVHGYNLWYPVFTHGFINTVAMILIYFDVDRGLTHFLF
jgi:membrane protease YdiL (CAAX protease family)